MSLLLVLVLLVFRLPRLEEEEAEASDFCRWPSAPRPRGLSLVTRIISSEDVDGRGEPKPTRTRTSLTSSHGAAILLRRFYCVSNHQSAALQHSSSFRSDRHRRPGLAVFIFHKRKSRWRWSASTLEGATAEYLGTCSTLATST